MKNIFTLVIIAAIILLGYVSCYAVPLEGQIDGLKRGTNSVGGTVWYSSYMQLNTPRNFMKGEQLRITLRGKAKRVYVRLLPKGADATTSIGIIGKRIRVPQNGVITVKLESTYRNIQQISVHSGREAFAKGLSLFNDIADIVSIDVSMGK